MNKTFSELFVEDKNSPKYTACISVILFNEFQRCKLIYTEKVATKACCLHKDIEYFEVPDDYTPRPINKAGHCLYLIYSYTSYYPPEPYPLRKSLIKEMCVRADCTGKYDLNAIHGEIVYFGQKCLNALNSSQKSVTA